MGGRKLKVPVRRRGAGCWLVALGSLAGALALVLVALLLPPFRLTQRLYALPYDPLNSQNPVAALSADVVVRLAGAEGSADFALQMTELPRADFDAGSSAAVDWLAAAKDSLPAHLALQSPLYALNTLGSAPPQLEFSLSLPPIAAPEVLDLYGWQGGEWRFIPAAKIGGKVLGSADFVPQALAIFQAIPPPPLAALFYDITQPFSDEAAQLADIISPAGLQPAGSGKLIGSLAPGGDADAESVFMPRISNYADPRAIDSATVEWILGNAACRTRIRNCGGRRLQRLRWHLHRLPRTRAGTARQLQPLHRAAGRGAGRTGFALGGAGAAAKPGHDCL